MSGAGVRILLLIQGSLDQGVSGPEIRGWEMAKGLAAEGHAVTAAVHSPVGSSREGVRLVPATRRCLVREAFRHDAIIAPCVPPYLFAAKAGRAMTFVSDQYDPVELELATLGGATAVRDVQSARAVKRLQLRFADLVLVAGERQRHRLVAEMEDLSGSDSAKVSSVLEVPFGLPESPQEPRRRPLRERFPQIAPTDSVVLWWGSVWRWLDAESAIHAFAGIADSRPDIKLVITAGRRPEGDTDRHSTAESARSLARSLGLLGRTVLFVDDWLPYSERYDYLAEADLGITLHHGTPEARIAARARYMDYLWASLPCVLAHGDEVADRFEHAGFARLVPPGDPAAVGDALLQLATDPHALERAKEAAHALAELYRWQAIVRPLGEILQAAGRRRRLSRSEALPLLREAMAYYARRAGDHVHGSRWALRRANGAGMLREPGAG